MSRTAQFQYLSDVHATHASPLRVLLLADTAHASHVVREHIGAFIEHSSHAITVMNPRQQPAPTVSSYNAFDAIVVHYSISILYETYLPPLWRKFVEFYPGTKALIIEDEYQLINQHKACIAALGFGVVFSVLDSPDTMKKVYGGDLLADTQFYCCLPGYITNVPAAPTPLPMAQRSYHVVYRGRTLPAQLGRLAYEKRAIGEQMQALAAIHGLHVDISSAEDSRIYGEAWQRFLQSGKTMLGVEGGASIFDFDGTLAEAVARFTQENPGADFETIWHALLLPHEGNVMFRTITPKFFEAIANKTALVLYPGDYSGILVANRHYIPLARDGSNAAEVIARLRDDSFLQAMADFAYDDILHRPSLQMSYYVTQVSHVLAQQHVARKQGMRRHMMAACQYLMTQLPRRIRSKKNSISKEDPAMRQYNYDAVVMLTWSDWKTEPRSNRYHYASRFSDHVPVLFLQIDNHAGNIDVEPSGHKNIELVHVGRPFTGGHAQAILKLLNERNIHRPLLWIYNSRDYDALLDALPNAMRVYHATEDYFSDSDCWVCARDEIIDSIRRLMPRVDLLVGVSQGVIDSYRQHAGFEGKTLLAENGCDAGFFTKLLDTAPPVEARIVIYQGGINHRLDYPLLIKIAQMLPDWNFWFCGFAQPGIEGWEALKALPNIHYKGVLTPDDFGKLMCRATVGIIPFLQDAMIYNSLPLKAFEYVACGLPVVSVPIAALGAYDDLFEFANTAESFAQAIESAADKRHDKTLLSQRRVASVRHSYDARFSTVCEEINMLYADLLDRTKTLNIAMLYDDSAMHINTVREHAESFRTYAPHRMFYIPSTQSYVGAPHPANYDLSLFDVIIVHYCVRIALPYHLSEPMAQQLERFRGLKILFIQDEYDTTETARRWMDRLQFDIVYTCVPMAEREKIYPSARFPNTDFLPTLTGYVPEDRRIDSYALPLENRRVHIAYRGRKLSYAYGTLGYEKFRIGEEVKQAAEALGIPVDIETDESMRIYGTDWYRFLGSARATLGTESGSNVFDFDGTVRARIDEAVAKHPKWQFADFHREILAAHENLVHMNQISPKIFEAIRLRTALVLFEGNYSGVVKPDLHFIPLKKDFSNLSEVFTKLADLDYLQTLTSRAYHDIIESGAYSYRAFVQGVVKDIDARMLHNAQYEIFAVPVYAVNANGVAKLVHKGIADDNMANTSILRGTFRRDQARALCVPEEGTVLGLPEVPIQMVAPASTPLRSFYQLYQRHLRGTFAAHCALALLRVLPFALRRKLVNRMGG